MTGSREENQAFENIAGYVLNSLDSDAEREEVEELISTDSAAQREHREMNETAGLLALGAEPMAPPARLRTSILDQTRLDNPGAKTQAPAGLVSRLVQSGYAASAIAAILVLAVAVTVGVQNSRLNNEVGQLRNKLNSELQVVNALREELESSKTDSMAMVNQMESEMKKMESDFGSTLAQVSHQEQIVSELSIANNALVQALRDQSWLTYVAMKEGYQVESWLANQQVPSDASGLIAVRVVGNEAVFQVHGLEQPLPGHAYTLWLIDNGGPNPVAQFSVSEIGSATVAFLLPAPLYLYSSVAVTQEPIGKVDHNPSGITVLSTETK